MYQYYCIFVPTLLFANCLDILSTPLKLQLDFKKSPRPHFIRCWFWEQPRCTKFRLCY